MRPRTLSDEEKRERYNEYMNKYYRKKIQEKEFQCKQKEYAEKKRDKYKSIIPDPLLNIQCCY